MASVAAERGPGWGWMLASGILAVVLGLVAIIWPFPATFAATLIVGGVLVATGVVALIAAARGKGHGRRGYMVAYGLLSIVSGALLTLFPVSGALTLTIFLTAWLISRAIMELIHGVRQRHHRAMMIPLGLLNLLLAALIWLGLPWSAFVLPGAVLGASLLFGGAGEIAAAIAHRRSVEPA